MKIQNLVKGTCGERVRVAASLYWENCNRPVEEVYFETHSEYENDLTCNPDAFLVACAVPALHYGEKRILMEDEVCPELRLGVTTALAWIGHWFNDTDRPPVQIEARTARAGKNGRANERAGVFISGGIDSLSTLRANRLSYSKDHPGWFKDGILVFGHEVGEPEPFKYVEHFLAKIASDAGLTLIPVYTNTYLNYRQEDELNGYSFWWYKLMGAALASVAHAFANRLSVVTIASDFDIPNQMPHGSHPLIDPNYSSFDLRIRHDGITLSRFEKTRLIAGWDAALQNLRVCNQYKRYQADCLNCGRCEKCLRTMLALTALDALPQATAFPVRELQAESLNHVHFRKSNLAFYQELIAPLAAIGRDDLVQVIKKKSKDYFQRQKTDRLRNFVKRLDDKYLNGELSRVKRIVHA